MNPVATQQVALDNALIALEKRLKIEKCNARIEFSKPQRKTRFPTKILLNLLSKKKWFHLSKNSGTQASVICYLRSIQIICTSPRDHMLLSSIDKTISMRNRINLHTVLDDTLLGTLKFVLKTEDYHKYEALIPEEMINQATKDSKAYKTYLDFATGKATPKKARKFKKIASPSQKLTTVLKEEPAKKPKRAKKPEPAKQTKTAKKTALAKKSSTTQTASVVIRDTPGVSVSKKKAQAKVDRGKGMDLLSDVSLLEATQLKKVLKKSKQDTHMLHVSGSDDGVGVLDVPKDQSESKNESWGESGDDDDSHDDDNNDDSDDAGNNVKRDDDHEQADDEQTEFNDEEDKHKMMSSYILLMNILTNAELDDKDKGDKEMTNDDTEDAKHENVIQESADVNIQHEVPRTLPLLSIPVSVIPEHNIINPPEIVNSASATTISSLLSSLFPYLQQLTPVPPPTATEATTSTTVAPDLLSIKELLI
uniref:Uncharacterized protein n=1 Tax=Tanacetum cinerariifolium TaxID=118510 RepID=A0A6L2M5J6_TANCI|nr:hypothetical protein [Tanacetum cinerariifolium]